WPSPGWPSPGPARVGWQTAPQSATAGSPQAALPDQYRPIARNPWSLTLSRPAAGTRANALREVTDYNNANRTEAVPSRLLVLVAAPSVPVRSIHHYLRERVGRAAAIRRSCGNACKPIGLTRNCPRPHTRPP